MCIGESREDQDVDLLDLGKTPISEQEPAGKDVRFEPDMEVILAEIEKLSSPTASGAIDWHKIANLSCKILAEQSKDLLVASYLCLALLQMDQLEGFAKGVRVLRDLLENFWENMYPEKKRMRGRKNAVEWWLEKITVFLEATQPVSLSQKEMEELRADLVTIDEFLGRNMEDAPGLGRLRGMLPSSEAASEEKAEEPPQGKPQEVPPKAGPGVAELPLTVEADADAEKTLKAGLSKITSAASFYMAKDIYDPVAYRLNRIAAWTPVREVPPSTDARTRIPAPPQGLKSSLAALYRGREWEGLLKTAESRVGEFLFWLDLNRYVAESLGHLGHDDLADLVSQETALYVRRLKGIESLGFADGTPFADEETRGWLRRIASPGGTAVALEIARPSDTEEGVKVQIEQVQARALALFKDKGLGEAVALLHEGLRDGKSGKEKMLWRLAVCELLMTAGKENTALPHLQSLLNEVDGHRLEEWDPALALEVLVRAHTAWRAQKGESAESRSREILDRIAMLDPATAVKMGG